MNQNFVSFHEENKPLDEYCEMIQNFASFQGENKPFECAYCGYPWNE